ncbi:MAG: protein TonB [Limimaricola cinnabarinus]|jgi:protein TonB|uniref:TonB family protein n=1 Tax=Limimaricola cinnabarinus TaxID=1125964 RepID=UPI0039E5B7B4
MRGLLEGGGFVALALGAHLALLGLRPEQGAPDAAGAGGAETVTLAAADARVVALVEDWERPPEKMETVEIAQPRPIEAPERPRMPAMQPDVAPSAPSAPVPPAGPGLAVPQAPEAPRIDTATAEPRQPMAEPPEERPQPRPDRPPEPKPEPEPKPAPQRQADPQRQPSPPHQAQRAAGTGGGAQAGAAQRQAAPSLSPGQMQSLVAQWGAQLRAQIERRKRYPNAARGASGTATVRITLDRAGRLTGLALVGSSGNPALDQAALAAVQAARLPASPRGLNDPSYSFTLPMMFNG